MTSNITQHFSSSVTTDVVVVDSMAKEYAVDGGTFKAIENVSFSMGPGEIVAIVGPSGCGKTTVLRAIAGLHSISDGSVTVNGIDVDGPPQDAAMVFQDYSRSLLPWFTVQRNVELPLLAQGVDKQEAASRAIEAIESVGLGGRERARPLQLSGGMQQRVAIARALAYRPKLLLMDEPFASVDAQTRMDLEDLVIPLRDVYGCAVHFVTHDIDDEVYLSDKAIVLD